MTGHGEPWDAPATPAVIGAAALGFFILGRCLDAWLQGTPGKHLMGCLVIDARSGPVSIDRDAQRLSVMLRG